VRAEDGVLLQGWHWPAPAGGKHSKITLLQLHGNAGSRHNRLYWAGPTTSLHTLATLWQRSITGSRADESHHMLATAAAATTRQDLSLNPVSFNQRDSFIYCEEGDPDVVQHHHLRGPCGGRTTFDPSWGAR